MEHALDTRRPAQLSPAERQAIVAALLAKGLLRSRVATSIQQNSPNNAGSFENLTTTGKNIA